MKRKNEFLTKIDEANEKLSNSPIIRGLIDGGLSLIPVFGSAISSSLDIRSFQLFEENSRRFAEEVRDIIKGIDESKINKGFLDSAEFTSLLIETLSRNAKTHENEKIKFFAKILVGFATTNGSQIPYKEGFIRIVDELSIDHINIMTFMFNLTKNPTETDERLKDRVKSQEISNELNLSEGRIQAYCEQMMRYGLLRDWALGKYGYQPGFYAFTEYGYEFITFLLSSLHEEGITK